MVVFNEQARIDLENIFDGLLAWKTLEGQYYIDNDKVINYHNDILDVCESLDTLYYIIQKVTIQTICNSASMYMPIGEILKRFGILLRAND
jgi:hypothetical protein